MTPVSSPPTRAIRRVHLAGVEIPSSAAAPRSSRADKNPAAAALLRTSSENAIEAIRGGRGRAVIIDARCTAASSSVFQDRRRPSGWGSFGNVSEPTVTATRPKGWD